MSVTVKMGNQQFLLRGHGLVTGLSGTGKTVALRNLERGLTETYKSTTLKIEVVAFEGDPDIFDARVNTAIGAIPAWAHCYPRVVIIIDGVLNCTDVTLSRLRQSMLVYDEGTPINYIVADTYLSAARFVGVQFGLLVRTIFRCHEYTLSVQEVSTREVSSVWISAEDLAVVHTQWMGVTPTEVRPLNLSYSDYIASLCMDSQSSVCGLDLYLGKSLNTGNETHSVRLCDSTLNMLTVGMTGSGKSSLLDTVLCTALQQYDPSELSVWMLHMKSQGEPQWETSIPQIECASPVTAQIFPHSILNMCRLRLQLLQAAGCKSYQEYRQANPHTRLPRVLVVVDEFQDMYNESETDAINKAMDAVCKLQRAAGVHLWFLSQSLSNSIPTSLQQQFQLRSALRCGRDLSVAVLGSPVASTLRERYGYVFTNDSGGTVPERTEMWEVPYVPEDDITRYIQESVNFNNDYTQTLMPGILLIMGGSESDRLTALHSLEQGNPYPLVRIENKELSEITKYTCTHILIAVNEFTMNGLDTDDCLLLRQRLSWMLGRGMRVILLAASFPEEITIIAGRIIDLDES